MPQPPPFDGGSAGVEVAFWYHMYGGGVGTLALECFDATRGWRAAWSLSGDQGDAWHRGAANCSSAAADDDGGAASSSVAAVERVRFRVTTGSSEKGDVARETREARAAPQPKKSPYAR